MIEYVRSNNTHPSLFRVFRLSAGIQEARIVECAKKILQQDFFAVQVLDEFYENLKSVGVSAVTGEGMDDLLKAVDDSRQEYNEFYRAELDKKLKVDCLHLIWVYYSP